MLGKGSMHENRNRLKTIGRFWIHLGFGSAILWAWREHIDLCSSVSFSSNSIIDERICILLVYFVFDLSQYVPLYRIDEYKRLQVLCATPFLIARLSHQYCCDWCEYCWFCCCCWGCCWPPIMFACTDGRWRCCNWATSAGVWCPIILGPAFWLFGLLPPPPPPTIPEWEKKNEW